jgi:hypothetical protein
MDTDRTNKIGDTPPTVDGSSNVTVRDVTYESMEGLLKLFTKTRI